MHNIIKNQFIKKSQNNIRANASKNQIKIHWVVKFILVAILTFDITIIWSSLAWAQIPYLLLDLCHAAQTTRDLKSGIFSFVIP
ncbi:MAG: hypothetical protein SWX82_33090 [Cyanobacteriota bacterium]|nr:hypothetical protein [Cyanobacteriota bacterium]